MKSLLEELPRIVAEGKREAAQILERLEGNYRVGLQTRELVIPGKDTKVDDLFRAGRGRSTDGATPPNRLIYGDNLLAMAALLAGDSETPPMRGKVNLIYIDPPFDSKADYRTKIALAAGEFEQKPTAIEQFAYSDTWQDGTASYLQMIVPRLCLMKEMLSETGGIFVHIDWHVGPYVKIALDDIFGKQNFVNEIIWRRAFAHNDPGRCGNIHDTIYYYSKTERRIWNKVLQKPSPDYIEQFFDQCPSKNFLSHRNLL
jgi:adenine-specific DNA-methyltransferase